MILRKWWRKFCVETLKKVFSNAKKLASRKVFRHLLRANFFMFILLISNHTVFLIQFGINLHLWVFQAEIALAEAARAISTFWKTHSCKLIPNWTQNRMITYTNNKQNKAEFFRLSLQESNSYGQEFFEYLATVIDWCPSHICTSLSIYNYTNLNFCLHVE